MPAEAPAPDRIARLYVVGGPLLLCLVFAGLALTGLESSEANEAAVLEATAGGALLGVLAATAGGTALWWLLRGPRGLGPSRHPATTYVVGGLAAVMIYVLLVGALAPFFRHTLGMTGAGVPLASMLAWVPAVLIALQLQADGPNAMGPRSALIAFGSWLPMAMMLPVLVWLNAAVLWACGLAVPAQEVMEEFQRSSGFGPRLALMLAICVMAPLAEELVFRGVIYRGMRDMAGKPAAIAGSALLFTAIHFAPTHTLAIFATGVILALLYERTGSLLAPITLHAVYNSASLVFATWAAG